MIAYQDLSACDTATVRRQLLAGLAWQWEAPPSVVIAPPPVDVCMTCREPVSMTERLFIGPRGSYLMHAACGVQVAIAAEIVSSERIGK